ncbi:DUF192 domain-containing protein [Roseibacterium sp. SDUM158016]|uniref:DUF192 domain-containing protein n=1 Tax=Roseicyclus sediminis TaxID=2980997 RepID=UPI0021D360D4|nr:DUF192 domain-containing protein [Roseibacterium sp. SDUM158016]MCU4654200.1 DUF192 domain-containing protein [Roseibacterium sp. SDUM158016]
MTGAIARLFSFRSGPAALAGAAIAFAAPAAQAACEMDRVELRGDWGTARFRVEIADTPETRARGLMFVEDMARNAGMLFVFPDERVRTFWMRNTLISLDIIYFDATGTWVSAAENAVPLDETTLPSDGPAQYVLEINGGLVERFGMGPGTEIRHPAIAQDAAAWSCDPE